MTTNTKYGEKLEKYRDEKVKLTEQLIEKKKRLESGEEWLRKAKTKALRANIVLIIGLVLLIVSAFVFMNKNVQLQMTQYFTFNIDSSNTFEFFFAYSIHFCAILGVLYSVLYAISYGIKGITMSVIAVICCVLIKLVGTNVNSDDGWSLLMLLILFFLFLKAFIKLITYACKKNHIVNSDKKTNKSYEISIETKNKEIEEIEQKINDTEKCIDKALELYSRALTEENEELMQQAADEGEENAIRYLRNKADRERKEKAAELYKQAISGDTVDRELLKQAADLGDESACFDLGKELYFDSISDYYTENEQAKKAKQAEKYLSVFESSSNIEGKFLYISLRISSGTTKYNEWEKILEQLRTIKASGKLPEGYNEALDIALKGAVQMINTLGKEKNSRSSSSSYTSVPQTTYKYDYDPHYAGTFLDSRETVKRILNDPSVSAEEKNRVVSEHKRWHLDNYDFGV